MRFNQIEVVMRFNISYGSGPRGIGYKDSFIMAEENAYSEIEEGLEEWLEENMAGRYKIECELIPDSIMICELILEFENDEDAMAYKLRWE